MSNITSAISPIEPLTTHLLSLRTPRPYSAATEHYFLTAAGDGSLPDELLSLYLSQDRLYAAHAYPAFIGRLLAAVPFSSLDAVDSPAEQSNQRIVRVLSDALQNVVREVGFFDETVKAFGLQSDSWRELKATRDYTAEMARIGVHGRIEDGLVFLWAMERVYLDAWKYVGSLQSIRLQGPGTAPAVAALVSNWTNPDFVKFVDDLADLVNSLDISPDSTVWRRAESIWARVIEIEEAFWPVGTEEIIPG
ncbi:heme oxygenase-like protein [Laetiporus sulphureus 93-53]|uniref:Heme oxygenase-like protein n=1 Tax=Laetiporus sulphureus 93-53 TaxID=1314785 RepID=A0A165CYG5_9APHY|nr:heme oxygenase-like protein [Laetiporus sulphureus 93-53]KZT03748.1 heme oxygenase-like protein [Laetiporus sulphureus 93-53]